MKSLPFDKPGKWYRGNLHTHSTRSDGLKSPAAICALYQRRGYHFVCVSDHFRAVHNWPITNTSSLRRKGFTTLIGAELHAPQTSLGDLWHILAVGLPTNFKPPTEKETGAQLAERAARAGAYVVVPHPAWYDLTDEDVLSIKAASAIEIFNLTCMTHNGKGDSTGYLDRLLSRGHRYHATAADDAHFTTARRDWGGYWVVVRSPSLTPDALLAALKAGHFYSSQGPEILGMRYRAARRTMTVRTSPIRAFRLSSRGSSALYNNATKDVTSFDLNLNEIKGPYARLTIKDARARQAWSNPFWF